jgi:hypothetical protein
MGIVLDKETAPYHHGASGTRSDAEGHNAGEDNGKAGTAEQEWTEVRLVDEPAAQKSVS